MQGYGWFFITPLSSFVISLLSPSSTDDLDQTEDGDTEWSQVDENKDEGDGDSQNKVAGVGVGEPLVAEDKGKNESESEFPDEEDIEPDEEMSEQEMLMEEKQKEMEREKVINSSQPIFKMADQDQDGHLNFEEFLAFATPENYSHMLGVLVDTYLNQFDVDRDGYITIEEFKGKYVWKRCMVEVSLYDKCVVILALAFTLLFSLIF